MRRLQPQTATPQNSPPKIWAEVSPLNGETGLRRKGLSVLSPAGGMLLLLLLLLPSFALASPVLPPATNLLVNDFAGVFTATQTRTLETRLEDFSDSTSNQICVVTVSDLQGYEASDFAQRLGQHWGVGSSKDNGVLILLKPRTEAERYIDVFIATGYGIEGALPDALCKRIINNYMGPCLRQDPPDYYGAVEAAVSQIEPIMLGEYNEATGDDESDEFFEALIVFIFIVLILLFLFGPRGRRRHGGWSSGSSWGASSGSWGGSSGGFSSGGSSFGGFGGGSFGGGGAGGRF